jgi:cytochrome c oxidase assembly protein subunit 11
VPSVIVRRGEKIEVRYRFENASAHAIEFQAVHRVTPQAADAYFHKQVCFCFERQRLAAGASAELPVRFVLDPLLPDSVKSLVLDYALFELAPGAAPSAPPPAPR